MTFPEITPGSHSLPPDAVPIAGLPTSAPVPDEDRYEQLVVRLHEAADTRQTVDRLLSFAVEFLGCDHATVALRRRGRVDVTAATDEVAHAALIAQLALGQGPCVTAIATGLSVLVPDIAGESRWPDWTGQIPVPGRSIFSIPLTAAGSTLGALNLIDEQPHVFDANDIRASRVATYGAVAIASAQRRESLVDAAEAGQRIGQAIGILRERFSTDEPGAFALLRQTSQHTNTKLRDIAQHLIDTGHLPT